VARVPGGKCSATSWRSRPTARFQIGCDCVTQQLRFPAGGLEFQQCDALGEAAALQPADAIVRRQRLGKATDHHHPAVAIKGFQQGCRRFAELQLGIHRIFDQWQLARVDQFGQALLGHCRHGAAERIVHGGHHHQCGQRRVLQQRIQRIHVEPVLRVGGQFDGLQAQVGQQRVEVEVGRRLDADRITWLGYCTQRQLQRFHCTVGQQQALGVGVQAHARTTAHDLRQQPRRTIRARVGLHRLLAMAQHLRGVSGQLRAGVELATARAGEGQVDHAGATLCLQYPGHQHLLQWCGGRGRGVAQRPFRHRQSWRNLETGLGPRNHQAGIFQLAIGGNHRVQAEPALQGHLPKRRQAAAYWKPAAVDGLGQFVGQPLVAGWDHRALVICIHRISRHLVLYP